MTTQKKIALGYIVLLFFVSQVGWFVGGDWWEIAAASLLLWIIVSVLVSVIALVDSQS